MVGNVSIVLDWSPVYRIQPVVTPVWQPVKCLYTQYNQLSNRFDNWLDVCLHNTAGCQTGCTTVWQLVVSCKWGM